MSAARAVRWSGALVAALVLVLAAARLSGWALISAQESPPVQLQGQSFSVDDGDPVTATGVQAADVLGLGGLPVLSCVDLGLLCSDPETGANDNVNSLSFGWDFSSTVLPPVLFSAGAGTVGAPGTAVRVEADCDPPEPQADVFETVLDGLNVQALDGDGAACGSNAGVGLYLTEGTASDNVDALEGDPCLFVDLDCDGVPENPIFLTLASGSPTLDLVGATPADILVTSGEYVPLVWAGGVADLGLAPGDEIDALCIRENGNSLYDSEDQILFSLAPGSPTLAPLAAGPADVLRPAPPSVVHTAAVLGLEPTDNVDGLICGAVEAAHQLFLPVILRDATMVAPPPHRLFLPLLVK